MEEERCRRGRKLYTHVQNQKSPKTPIKQTKRTKETNLGRNRFLKKVCQISKLFFFPEGRCKVPFQFILDRNK